MGVQKRDWLHVVEIEVCSIHHNGPTKGGSFGMDNARWTFGMELSCGCCDEASPVALRKGAIRCATLLKERMIRS